MESFSRSLQLLLGNTASKEKEQEDALNKLLSVALEFPGNLIISRDLRFHHVINDLVTRIKIVIISKNMAIIYLFHATSSKF